MLKGTLILVLAFVAIVYSAPLEERYIPDRYCMTYTEPIGPCELN